MHFENNQISKKCYEIHHNSITLSNECEVVETNKTLKSLFNY